jgi:hypothetical protein
MAPPLMSVFGLVLSLTWTCLVFAKQRKNALYDQILYSKELVFELATTSSLSFAPGLAEALESKTSPSIAFFKSLPRDFRKSWGVDVIILERKDSRPKIYVGSRTGWVRGMWTRIMNYIRGDMLPRLVKKAVNEGYSITHKGLLVWAHMPSATNKSTTRLLFLALETIFHFHFWSLVSKSSKEGYDMRELCPWALEDIEYDGCNSHSPLTEQPFGDFDLTPEEREAVAEELYQRSVQ